MTGIIVAAMMFFGLASCSEDPMSILQPDPTHPGSNYGDRLVNEETRKVLLLYSAGFNSLTSYLKEDIEDLKQGWLPTDHRTDDVVLVYSHFPSQSGKYNVGTSPVLVRLYTRDETVIADTLVVYPDTTISASAEQLNKVLTFVKNEFQAKSYGMIFSSHATGYLPAGYYQKPNNYVFEDDVMPSWKRMGRKPVAVPFEAQEHDPSLPMTKSIGQDQVGEKGSYLSYEIELPDFTKAIPMKLDYLLFDACLMGGVEVAYELREKVRTIGFSQTEVLAEGFNYKQLTTHLLNNEESDPVSVCEDFFIQYDIQSGLLRSATISVVDCSKLAPLTDVCRDLFEKYSEQIRTLDSSGVQKFFRYSYHWFYDLESIVLNAGATPEEIERLRSALHQCIIYKGNTPYFFQGDSSGFEIKTFSGFSMYLPSRGSSELDEFYKTLKWNQATGLVQ